MKTIGLLTVLSLVIASAAYLPAGDDCSSGKCSQKLTADSTCPSSGGCCSEASGTTLTSTGDSEKCCGECPSTKLTSKGESEKCSSGQCPSTKLTSSCTAGDSSCAKGETVATSAHADGKGCPVSAAMAKLPQMKYRVGTEDVCCPKAAGELAETAKSKVHFVVADKAFDCEVKAKQALVDATEHFVATFAKPKKCEKSGNITVAGHKACCEGTAAHLGEIAKNAMSEVEFTYVVGEKSCHCPVEAEKLAKDSGEARVYVVGDQKTACEVTARLNLARAKYKAAVVALVQATAGDNDESSTDS